MLGCVILCPIACGGRVLTNSLSVQAVAVFSGSGPVTEVRI